MVGEQRCEDCNTFAVRVGTGGHCPHCDEPVALLELLHEAPLD
jgi:phage FluMu protein Com